MIGNNVIIEGGIDYFLWFSVNALFMQNFGDLIVVMFRWCSGGCGYGMVLKSIDILNVNTW